MAGIIDLVGNTPLVEITRLNPNPKVKIYAKLEGNNPGGSVKDRAALNMIRSALERGEINKNTKLTKHPLLVLLYTLLYKAFLGSVIQPIPMGALIPSL